MAKLDFKKNFRTILILGVIGLIGAYLVVCLITSLLNGDFSADGIISSFGDSRTLTWFFILAGAGLAFFMLTFVGAKKDEDFKGQSELENVHWMTEKEMDKNFQHCKFSELKNKYVQGVPFRAVYSHGDIKIHFTPNYHILIVGTTGSGKGVCFVEPTIQIVSESKTKPSLFITDPKGELINRHSQKLHDCGYDIKILDLVDPYNSLKWNPLESIYTTYQRMLVLEQEIYKHTNDDVDQYDYIKVGEISNSEWYEFDRKAFSNLRDALTEVEVLRVKLKDECFEDINDIASALCPVTDQKQASWEQGARDYVIAVLLAMLEDSENPALGMTKEKYNFYNMYKIAMNKENDMEFVKDYFSGRSPLSKTTQLCSHIIFSNAKQTRDSYMSTLNQKLALFSDNGICYLTSKNEIDFKTFDNKPTAFFIKIPDEKETRYGLATVCISQSYKEFVKKARDNEVISKDKKKAHEACLNRPLYYIMDEFANMPQVNKIDKIITVARSRKIFLNMVIQSYSQLENVYGKETAGIIMGNCNAKFYLGTPDLNTREEFSKELGNYQVKVGSKSESPDKGADGKKSGTSVSKSTQLQSRPLMFASDLDKIKMGNIIVKIFPYNPVNSTVTPYFKCTDVYKLGKLEMPYIPGNRFNEEEVFYDIKERNRKILNN